MNLSEAHPKACIYSVSEDCQIEDQLSESMGTLIYSFLWKRGARSDCSLRMLAYQATHLRLVVCLSIQITLDQGFSKCGQDLPAARASPGNLLENQLLRPTQSEIQGVGMPGTVYFHKHSG